MMSDDALTAAMIKALGLPPGTQVKVISQAEMDAIAAGAAEVELDRQVTDAVTATTGTVTPVAGTERFENAIPALIEIMDNDLWDALEHAITKHRPMHSPHEGYAVIKEELEELWNEIKADGGGRDDNSRREALQVAAMAIRYVLDLDPHD